VAACTLAPKGAYAAVARAPNTSTVSTIMVGSSSAATAATHRRPPGARAETRAKPSVLQPTPASVGDGRALRQGVNDVLAFAGLRHCSVTASR
jgi:hypothetical protein